jgi:hypothetical protein
MTKRASGSTEQEEDGEEDGGRREREKVRAVLKFVLDSEMRPGLCPDLFEELMEMTQVRWAERVRC